MSKSTEVPQEETQKRITGYRTRISMLLGALRAQGVEVEGGLCFCHVPRPIGGSINHSARCLRAQRVLHHEANLNDLNEVVLTSEEEEMFDQRFVDNVVEEAMRAVEKHEENTPPEAT